MSRRRKLMAEINVVPYVDVTFVLLIIFMVTAPLQQSSVEVNLPVASGTVVKPDQKLPVIITISKEGQYYLSEKGSDDVAISMEDLLLRVVSLYDKNPHTQVYIRGDKTVDYGKVVTVMAALKNAGIARIGLLTAHEG